MSDANERYARLLTRGRRPVRVAAATLAAVLSPSLPLSKRRLAAARAIGAAAVLLPAALARHASKRGGDPDAAWDVAEKFGRPSDLDEPSIGVRAQWDRLRLDPRLGGLLGDSADVAAHWLASTSRVPAAELSRAVAAVAPLVLGALVVATESAAGLASALARFSFPPTLLEAPSALDVSSTHAGRLFASVTGAARGRGGLARLAFWVRS